MKKTGIIAVLAVLLAACGPSYDEDGFDQLVEWSEAAISQADETAFNIAVDGTADYEPLDDLVDQADLELPGHDEIEQWMINMSTDSRDWTIEGPELSDAFYELIDGLDRTAADLDMQAPEDDLYESAGIMVDAGENLHDVLMGR